MDNNHLFEDEVDEEMAREKAEREAREVEPQQQNYENNSSSYDPEQNVGNNSLQDIDYNQSQNTGNNVNYTVEADRNKGFAIAGFVISLVSLLLCCTGCNILFAILALVFSIIYLCSNNSNKSNKGFAVAGVIIAGVSIIITVIYYAMFLSSPEFQEIYDDMLESIENEYYSEPDEMDEFEDLFDEKIDEECEDGSCMSNPDSGRGRKHYQDLREEEDGSL